MTQVPDPYAAAPWLTAYPGSVPREPAVPDLPLGQLLDEVVSRFAPHTAVVCGRTRLTYSELRARVDRLAATLHRLGVQPGDRVAIILPNTPEFVVTFFATVRLGAVAVPLNPLAPSAELGDHLADSGAHVAVCLDRAVAGVQEVRERTQLRDVLVTSMAEARGDRLGLRTLLPLPSARRKRRELWTPVPKAVGVTRLAEALRDPGKGVPRLSVDPDAAAVLAYTSGTTGAPRATVLTHRNLIANGYQVGWWLPDVRPGREVSLAVLPLFHPFGLVLCLHTTVLLGGTVVLVSGFDQREVLAAFDSHAPTLFSAVPAVFRALLDNRDLRGYRTGALRAGIAIGAHLPDVVAEAYERLTSSVLVEGYGLAEAPVTHAVPVGVTRRPGVIGVPLPLTEARIVDPDEPKTVLPIGAVGELAIRGPQVSDRSWGGAGTPSADGYVLTGDLASMDADGYFTVLSRAADVLRIGGEWVSPAEIEAVIAALPQVSRVAVVAGADGPVAYVQRVHGQDVAATAIISVCARALAPELVPGRVEFRATLPLTGAGTVLRRVLRAQEPAASAPAEKAASMKRSAPAEKAVTKNAAPAKTVAAKVPAKRAAGKKAPVKRGPAKQAAKAPAKQAAKAPAKKTAKAPAKRAAVTKRATSAKAAPVKKTDPSETAEPAKKSAVRKKAASPRRAAREQTVTSPRENGTASPRQDVVAPSREDNDT